MYEKKKKNHVYEKKKHVYEKKKKHVYEKKKHVYKKTKKNKVKHIYFTSIIKTWRQRLAKQTSSCLNQKNHFKFLFKKKNILFKF